MAGRHVLSLGLASGLACAAPGIPNDPLVQQQLSEYYRSGTSWPCHAPECTKPHKKYESLLNVMPGVQWMDHGGYCGSWSIQRLAMAKGVWLSQSQVRNHTVPGGGNDEEILATNIDLALKNLKLKAEGFDYKHLPTPQADAYRKWIKGKLVAGHGVAWMIMLHGGHFPVYPGLEPYGQYSHVEPVVGIMSDRPLTDPNFYDDDVLVHYTDADENAYYRTMKSLPDDTDLRGNCADPAYPGYPCIYEKYGFGWAIEGVQDERDGLPLSLNVHPSTSEPDTRTGRRPIQLTGTVTISGLTSGTEYTINRWDSVEDAFDYSKAKVVKRFTASGVQYTHTDASTFTSSGVAYYRCIKAASSAVVV